jgi:hypothetical protein
MLKSYEAIVENNQVKWLTEQPEIKSARVIVTILEETTLSTRGRTPSASITGEGKTLSDIVSSIIPEEDWECLTQSCWTPIQSKSLKRPQKTVDIS